MPPNLEGKFWGDPDDNEESEFDPAVVVSSNQVKGKTHGSWPGKSSNSYLTDGEEVEAAKSKMKKHMSSKSVTRAEARKAAASVECLVLDQPSPEVIIGDVHCTPTVCIYSPARPPVPAPPVPIPRAPSPEVIIGDVHCTPTVCINSPSRPTVDYVKPMKALGHDPKELASSSVVQERPVPGSHSPRNDMVSGTVDALFCSMGTPPCKTIALSSKKDCASPPLPKQPAPGVDKAGLNAQQTNAWEKQPVAKFTGFKSQASNHLDSTGSIAFNDLTLPSPAERFKYALVGQIIGKRFAFNCIATQLQNI